MEAVRLGIANCRTGGVGLEADVAIRVKLLSSVCEKVPQSVSRECLFHRTELLEYTPRQSGLGGSYATAADIPGLGVSTRRIRIHCADLDACTSIMRGA